MHNPYQRKLIGDMIMNMLLTMLLVINLLPVNIGARIVADETPSGEPTTGEVGEQQEQIEGESNETDDTVNNENLNDKDVVSDGNGQNDVTVNQEGEDKKEIPVEGSGSDDLIPGEGNDPDNDIPVVQDNQIKTEEDTKVDKTEEDETPELDKKEEEKPQLFGAKAGSPTLLTANEGEQTRGISGITIQMPGTGGTAPEYELEQSNYRDNTISLTFLLYRERNGRNNKWNITKVTSYSVEGKGIKKVTATIDESERNVLYVIIEIEKSYSEGSITLTLDGHAEDSTSTQTTNNKDFKIMIPEPKEYFVSIGDHENGSLSVNPSAASSGTSIDVTAEPDDEYRLGRLYYSDGVNEVDITGNSFNLPKSDVTVNAVFDKVYSVVAKEAENGSIEVSPDKAVQGETITVTAIPKDNYGLKRLYYEDKDGKHEIAGTSFEMPASDADVYAEFAELFSVNISDPIDNGTVTVDKAKAIAGETITVTANPSFSDYELTSLYYMVGQQRFDIESDTFSMPESDVTVYAVFERLFSVSVSNNISHGSVSVIPTKSVAGKTITVTATPSRGYYLNRLYYTTGSGHSQTQHEITGDSFIMPESDVTVYATFSSSGYKVSISDNISHGSVSATPTRTVSGKTITVTVNPDRGYSLTSLYYTRTNHHTQYEISGNSFVMPKSDVTVSAKFDAIDYTISYDLAGGNLPQGRRNPTSYDVETRTFTLTNPQRKGYTFAGWVGTDCAEASTKVTIQKGSIGNREYTATWTKDTYTISYNLAGGDLPGEEENPTSYDVDTSAFTLINPQREGYTFAGWRINDRNRGTNVTINGINYKPAENLNVVARWDVIEYPIYYNNVSEATVTNPKKYTVEREFTLNNPTREGYDFLGWTGSNGEIPQLNVKIVKGTTGELIFNANWIKIEYDNVSATGAEHTKGVDGNATFIFKRNNNDDETVEIEGVTVSRTYANFLAADKVVKVDGNQLSESQYEASSGSLIIVLKKDYLDSLSVGKHELSVDFLDGGRIYTSTANFIVKLKPADTPSFVVPTTGIHNNNNNGNTLRSLSMFALIALGITIKMRNKVGKDYWEEFK